MTVSSFRLFLIAAISLPFAGFGQAIDNTATYRMINAEKYTRLHYDNDYFSNGDLYYTQGVLLEMVRPSFSKLFTSKLLITANAGRNQFGLALEHNGYTPTSIRHDEILYNDRPFTAAVMLKAFSSSTLSERRIRITSALTSGIIGPIAGGKQIQQTLHRWVHDEAPHGWQNQISNDVILNYEVGIEKNLFYAGDILVLNAVGNGRIGSLSTKATAGAGIMAGKLNQAIRQAFSEGKTESHSNFTFHLYVQSLINVVGYDATLQGGLLNHSSPYVLSARSISRITFQQNVGLAVQIRRVCMEYSRTILSREFETGVRHGWGGIRIGVTF